MATTTRRRRGVKRQDAEAGNEARQIGRDQWEELARQGARQILMAALQDERDIYLGLIQLACSLLWYRRLSVLK